MTDHSLIIMSLLCVQEARNRLGLEEIRTREEKLSCGVRRTSGELDRCVGERSANDNAVFISQHCKVCYHISLQQN